MTDVSNSFIIANMRKLQIISSAKTFGERLKMAREKKCVSQQKIADLFGIDRISVSNWERGKNPPTADKLAKLSEFLDISVDWLLGTEKDSNVASTTIRFKTKTVPLISWVQAGQWKEVNDIHPVGQSDEYISVTAKVGPNAIALKVRGDSMEPEFPEGSIIIVDPDREAKNGSYVVVRLDEEMEATFKQMVVDGSRIYLKPINPRYPILEINGKKATTVGVVVQMVKEY